MIDEYKAALDELRFSPEARRRLVQALEAAAAPERPRRASRRTRTLAIAAAAALLALVVGCTAYAAGILGRPAAKAETLPATEVVDRVGRPVASASSNGVTVTAEAVVGDRSNYAVVLRVAKDDGTAFEGIRENEDGTLALRFGNLATVTIGGAPSRGTASYFFDADPDDNAIQFVKTSTIDTHGGGSFLGRPVRVKLFDLMALDEDGEARTLVKGAWRMSFLANCADLSRNVPAGQTFAFDEGTATINAITISPLSLSVDLMIDFPIGLGPTGAGTPESKRLQELPLTVNMKDGIVVDATRKGGGGVEVREQTTVTDKHVAFDRFLDLDEVASITVGSVEIPISSVPPSR